jgi:hypothetical protein
MVLKVHHYGRRGRINLRETPLLLLLLEEAITTTIVTGDLIGKIMITIRKETETGDGPSLQNLMIEDKEAGQINIDTTTRETSIISGIIISSITATTILITEEMTTETFIIIEDTEISMTTVTTDLTMTMTIDSIDHRGETSTITTDLTKGRMAMMTTECAVGRDAQWIAGADLAHVPRDHVHAQGP